MPEGCHQHTLCVVGPVKIAAAEQQNQLHKESCLKSALTRRVLQNCFGFSRKTMSTTPARERIAFSVMQWAGSSKVAIQRLPAAAE